MYRIDTDPSNRAGLRQVTTQRPASDSASPVRVEQTEENCGKGAVPNLIDIPIRFEVDEVKR